MPSIRAVFFDIGGVVVLSPIIAINKYEVEKNLPKDYLNVQMYVSFYAFTSLLCCLVVVTTARSRTGTAFRSLLRLMSSADATLADCV